LSDPYKYSDYSLVKNSEPLQLAQPGPFNHIIRDGIFNDADQNDRIQDFDFDDLIPILEEEYDLEAAFRHYEADADYRDEGERDPPVPAQPQPAGDQREEDQPPVLRLTPPIDQRRRVSTLRRPLPGEGEEEEGAVGGEVWQTPASVDAQREFYTALLDEIDSYTRAAEVTQRTVRSLGTAQQQEKI
jgi:hypothetical protein